jgi:hypothetical protein
MRNDTGMEMGMAMGSDNSGQGPGAGFDAALWVDQSAALLGLALDPAHRPGTVLNLERAAGLARLVMEFPLPPEAEAAPVFTP